jgi:YD repeat-containing protein
VGIGSSSAYGAAASLTGDIVVAESLDNYDNDGNVIETIQKDRISTDANTSTGALNSAGSAPYARVSYAASYYDAADRDVADVNVGTNGGSSWSGPTTLANVPSGSLVTSYIYDTAGRLSFETDPRGLITAYGYDALGETTITVANWTPSTFMGPVLLTSLGSPTNSSNQTTEYTYDGDGHVVELPPGTTGTFLYQGKKQELRPGSQTINSLVPF